MLSLKDKIQSGDYCTLLILIVMDFRRPNFEAFLNSIPYTNNVNYSVIAAFLRRILLSLAPLPPFLTISTYNNRWLDRNGIQVTQIREQVEQFNLLRLKDI